MERVRVSYLSSLQKSSREVEQDLEIPRLIVWKFFAETVENDFLQISVIAKSKWPIKKHTSWFMYRNAGILWKYNENESVERLIFTN